MSVPVPLPDKQPPNSDFYQIAYPDDESFPEENNNVSQPQSDHQGSSSDSLCAGNGLSNGHIGSNGVLGSAADVIKHEEEQRELQSQVHRVVTENMILHNKVNKQEEQLKKLRSRRAGTALSYNGDVSLDSMNDADLVRLETLASASTTHSGLLEVFDINEFCRLLITDLHPRIGRLLMPCHPSYLLVMALRLHDNVKDESGMTALFACTHAAIKETVGQSGEALDVIMNNLAFKSTIDTKTQRQALIEFTRSSDLDVLTLWLVNTWRLVNLLRQYSSEENPEWGTKNTERQKEHGFKNFSVAPLLEKLQARTTDAYEVLMKRCIEPVLQPKILPALLHHNAAKDFEAPPTTAGYKKNSGNAAAERMAEFALDDLIEFLNIIHDKLTVFGADPTLTLAVFSQMSRWLCAVAMNHLMFRKDMCNFERAVQIKHNVQQIQSWLANKNLEECRVLLEPLVQASHVLQSPKDEVHVDKMVDEMTSMLNTQQILSLLRHYHPVEIGYEEGSVSANVLAMVENRLKRRQLNPLSPDANDTAEEFHLPKPALMTTHLVPFELDTFVYSDVNLTNVTLPKCLHMDDIARQSGEALDVIMNNLAFKSTIDTKTQRQALIEFTRSSDLDVLTLWLVNTWRLVNLLRQYSSEENPEWGTKNTERQKEHGFKNFSVAPLLEKLQARTTDAYEVLMKRCIEPVLQPKILPALLHHNAAKDFEAPPTTAGYKKNSGNAAAERMAEFALDDLIEFLNIIHDKLTVFGADPTLTLAVFSQMSRWLCAVAMNHLMFRKDMCNFERAVQIKHNVQQIQSWLANKNLEECRVLLEPLVQASHVLQSPKDEVHVDKMVDEMTSMLNTQQILSLLRHYHPVEIGYEEGSVSANVLAMVENRLKRRQLNPLSPDANDTAEEFHLPKPALMTTHLVPFELDTFVYSDVNLTNVTLPKCLHMDDIARVL